MGDGACGCATRASGKLKRGAVNFGHGLADDLGEFGHKAKTVGSSLEKIADVNGYLNLV